MKHFFVEHQVLKIHPLAVETCGPLLLTPAQYFTAVFTTFYLVTPGLPLDLHLALSILSTSLDAPVWDCLGTEIHRAGQPHFLKIPPGDPDSVWLETHDQKWSARSLYHMKEHRPCGPADVGIPLDYWLGTSPSWRGPVFQVFNFLNQERGGSGVAHPALKTGSGSGGVLGRSPNGSSCVVNWGKVWVALGP